VTDTTLTSGRTASESAVRTVSSSSVSAGKGGCRRSDRGTGGSGISRVYVSTSGLARHRGEKGFLSHRGVILALTRETGLSRLVVEEVLASFCDLVARESENGRGVVMRHLGYFYLQLFRPVERFSRWTGLWARTRWSASLRFRQWPRLRRRLVSSVRSEKE
jgi:hypothetical protein